MKICPACSKEYGDDVDVCRQDAVALVHLETGAQGGSQDLVGQVINGRYRIERVVGRGGMGTVYACEHVVVGKAFAMKVLRTGIERSEEVLQRFIREAKAANAVRSRHICEMTDFGQMPNGAFYVVMELLEGVSLTRYLRDQSPKRRDLKHIFVQIAETLQRAHDQQIVHRDLKPDNVVLVRDEGDPLFVKLVDFGIAKMMQQDASNLTETGIILGTPYYMSPEQARGDALDHRSDVYSLGVMMYRAFTGQLPFVADTAMGVLTRHLTEKPQAPSQLKPVDPVTERLILRCLEKRPIDRFQSMTDVAEAIRSIPDELDARRSHHSDPGAMTGSLRARQVTPTRVDGPVLRSDADSDANGPKSTDPTPLVVSRASQSSTLPSANGTAPPMQVAPTGVPSQPGTFAEPRSPYPSLPSGRGSSPSIPNDVHGVSGRHPMMPPTSLPGAVPTHSSPSGFGYGSGTFGAPVPYPTASQPYAYDPSLPPHLQGEAHTHRGLVSTRMPAKSGGTNRIALGVGAFLFMLTGIGVGVFVFRGGRNAASDPTSSAATAENAPLPGVESRNPKPQPPTDPVSMQAASSTAEPTAPTASASASSRVPGPLPTASPNGRGASGFGTGAPAPSATPRPHGDEIRSPFD